MDLLPLFFGPFFFSLFLFSCFGSDRIGPLTDTEKGILALNKHETWGLFIVIVIVIAIVIVITHFGGTRNVKGWLYRKGERATVGGWRLGLCLYTPPPLHGFKNQKIVIVLIEKAEFQQL